jgi:uncharacterized protein YndB with AHSA1/START domain
MTPPNDIEPIKLSLNLPIAQQSAWDYFLNPELRTKWWSPEVMLEGKLYGRFIEPWRDDSGNVVVTRGEVIDIKTPELLRFTWADPGWNTPTLVSLIIQPNKKGSRLELVHSGWEHLRAEVRFTLRQTHEQGWTELFNRLTKVIM